MKLPFLKVLRTLTILLALALTPGSYAVAFLPDTCARNSASMAAQGLGYVIAAISLVFMVILTIALAAMLVMLALREIGEDHTIALVFGVLSILNLLFSILLFRRIIPAS